MALFLASDDARFVNGATRVADARWLTYLVNFLGGGRTTALRSSAGERAQRCHLKRLHVTVRSHERLPGNPGRVPWIQRFT